jgi:predicted lipid-binding transport protein (Tim44 family)
MGDGFQFWDLIFFGVVAVFLVMRLRSVLGRRTGSERHRDPFAGAPAKDQPAAARAPNAPVPDIAAKPVMGTSASGASVAGGLTRIRSADPSFDENQFLAGARSAFEIIVNAYAAGDSAALRPLLSEEVFANFSNAIEERRKSGHTHSTTLVGIRGIDII